MKKILATLMLLSVIIALTACATDQTSTQSEGRCGDAVCDGPENISNCPEDCSGGNPISETENTTEDSSNEPAINNSVTDIHIGYVNAEVQLDRTAGVGDCGVEPWYSPDCSVMKIWWDMHLKAIASTPVLIIPDGNQRWVITNEKSTVDSYNIDLATIASTTGGTFTTATLDPATTNPECQGNFEASDFSFDVIGTRENSLTELIFSANPSEYASGSCMGAGYEWTTTHLLYGWAAALSGDPQDLSFEMNDTFRQAPGQYTFEIETDVNPSPEKRDRMQIRLEFFCLEQQAPNIQAPTACPWE